MLETSLQQVIHTTQSILAAPAGAEAVALLCEFPLEDRFQHMAHRPLHDPVPHRGNPQRPLLPATRLRDEYPPDSLRPVGAAAQCRC